MSDKGFSEESLREIAEQKINYKYTVKIHFIVFVLVNALLLFINLITLPWYLWVLFPILGWNIAVVEHILSYILYARGVYPDSKRGVYYHLFAFLPVMVLLCAIDLNIMFYSLISTATLSWSLIPGIFWGFGLIVHIAVYRIYWRGDLSEEGVVVSRKDKQIEKEMQKMRKKLNR